MSNMADEYTANGAYEPAEQMYTKCLGARRTKLGRYNFVWFVIGQLYFYEEV